MYNTNILYIYVNLLIFFISFLIKLGISPFFLFKLEIYRGMPLYNIFFYSVVFFLLFFIIFFLILYYYLPILVGSLHFFFNLILLFSVITVIFFLFDNTLLRNFFAFSSVINSINLTILLI
jgi:NADH:ubiquinone oxidoreductase subunit 2 (subunit N)